MKRRVSTVDDAELVEQARELSVAAQAIARKDMAVTVKLVEELRSIEANKEITDEEKEEQRKSVLVLASNVVHVAGVINGDEAK